MSGSYKIYKINPANGQVVTSFNAPDYEAEYPYGLAWADSYLWVSNSNGIYKIDPQTGNILETCNNSELLYGQAYGLTYDGKYFWEGHIYCKTKQRANS